MYTVYTVVGALVCRQAWQQGGKWRKPVAIACETRQLYCARLCFYFGATCQATSRACLDERFFSYKQLYCNCLFLEVRQVFVWKVLTSFVY